MCFDTRIKKVEIKIKHIVFFIIFFYWITCLSLLRGLIHSHLHDSIDFLFIFIFYYFFYRFQFLLNKLDQMIIINFIQEQTKSRYHKNNQVYLDTNNGETQQCNFKRSSSDLYYLRRFHAIHHQRCSGTRNPNSNVLHCLCL